MSFTEAQLAKWDNIVATARAINLRVKAAAIGARNIAAIVQIGRRHGIELGDSVAYLSTVQQLQAKDDKYQRIINAVLTEELGIRFRGGEIDIMAPADSTDDELIQYQGLGIAGIVIGIVIVFGAVAFGAHFFMESTKIAKRNKLLVKQSKRQLCADPDSDECEELETFLASDEYQDTQSLYDSAMEAADDAGELIRGGLHWGVALAIPVALWMIFKD
jgi:hypothetical protein